MSKKAKDGEMVLLRDVEQSAILAVPVEIDLPIINMSDYRSELIEEASQRIKSRRAESEVWAKKLAEFDEQMELKLDELRAKKAEKLTAVRDEWAALHSAMWIAQKKDADNMEVEIAEKKKSLLAAFAEDKSKLEKRLQEFPIDLGGERLGNYYREKGATFLKGKGYVGRLIAAFSEGKTAIVSKLMVDFGPTPKEINSDVIFKKIWLGHLYPVIANQFEKEKGVVYGDGALPKKGNVESLRNFFRNYYFDRLITPVLKFFKHTNYGDEKLLLTEYFFNKLLSHCRNVSDDTLSFPLNHKRIDKPTYIDMAYFGKGPAYNDYWPYDWENATKQYILFMTALVDFGLPKEEFTVSQFLDFAQRMVASETYFGVDGFSAMGSETPSGRPDVRAETVRELNDFMARFVEEELLSISEYIAYFPGLIHRKIIPTKENLEKLLMEMQESLMRIAMEKEKAEVTGGLEKVKGCIIDIDRHPEIVALRERQAALRKVLVENEQYSALENQIDDLDGVEFLNSADEAEADGMKAERRALVAKHDEYLKSVGLGEQSGVENYLIGANLDSMPFFRQELEVLLMKRIFGYRLKVILFEAKSDQYKKSVEGRAEKRAMDMEEEFLDNMEDVFSVDRKERTIKWYITSKIAGTAFEIVPAMPNWWYKFKKTLARIPVVKLAEFDTTTKQSLMEELVVHEDLEGFCRLNEWLFKLHKVGLVLFHSDDLKTKELGELHLEIARVLREKFSTLPESIEARLAVPEVDIGALSDTLSVLPSILQRQGQAQLLKSIDETVLVSEDLADLDGGKAFDRKLALVTAANGNSEETK